MNPNEAPQWLRETLTGQQQELSETKASMSEVLAAMSQMNTRLSELSTSAPVPSTPATTTDTEGQSTNEPPITTIYKKSRMITPEKFNGEDLALYPQWETKILAKLDIDGELIGGHKERCWYIFGCLTGKAAARIHPWIAYAQTNDTMTVEGLCDGALDA